MLRSSLAERLKELRADTGRSADEVADAVGIKRSTLATIESGHDNPGRETLVALANYYRVSLDWLTSGEGEKYPAWRCSSASIRLSMLRHVRIDCVQWPNRR